MRILIVEDEKRAANLVRRGLEVEGYDVSHAMDADSAEAMAAETEFDLFIIDVMLPGRDGLALIRELRRRQIQAPVLCVTGRDKVDDIVNGLNTGADGYLVKPYAFSELAARVRALARRSASERGAELIFADLRIDPVRHRVWRGETEIPLTGKEYSLLEYFIRNPGKVLSRSMLLTNTWEEDSERQTNIVDVYVNYLRRKVDRKNDRKLIHTVRGVGYVLSEEPVSAKA